QPELGGRRMGGGGGAGENARDAGVTAAIDAAEAARARFWPEAGGLHYRSPGPLPPALRELVLANRDALLARLGEWDGAEASRLMRAADDLVGELGVSGADPAIQEAAALCVGAHHREDMAGVRKGCALVEDRARKLARNEGARAA
ncbi:MAG: hypothetical protein K2V38_05440, partial [Gemmataceae bacterium]|nr:hypothetical protein [Gemmataceae bacterium]